MGVNWDRVLGVLSGVLVTLCVVAAGSFYLSTLQAQALRFGQKLPSGPPRYYLREGSPQFICAPYLQPGETTPVVELRRASRRDRPDSQDAAGLRAGEVDAV